MSARPPGQLHVRKGEETALHYRLEVDAATRMLSHRRCLQKFVALLCRQVLDDGARVSHMNVAQARSDIQQILPL